MADSIFISDSVSLPRSRAMAKFSPAERLRMKSRIDSATGCVIFTGYIAETGYGLICIATKTQSTHRLSWECANGPIPAGCYVLHRCDVRACINPDHLFLGSQDDNMKDMSAKGRSSRGEKNHKAKLNEDQVRSILADRRSHRAIGRDMRVTKTTVGDIKRGRIWRHITGL